MNTYLEDYLSHNLPLILLSGLEDESQNATADSDRTRNFLGDGGFHIRAEIPPVRSKFARDLRAILLECDCSDRPWHAPKPDSPDARYAFRIRSVGRSFTFPPRKAPPPAHSPRFAPSRDGASPAPLTLHSPLSPLSPSSPLYPDGIITPWWITKHQYRLPSVLVSFYSLTADPNTSSLEDNKIKNEVNNIRTLIASTNYKSKHVLVLVGEGALDANDLEDRLINIRRGTNFDSKALYYLPSSSSPVELRDFSRVLFQTLYTPSIEYYRDLSKHARRKRNRNTVPQPTVPPPQGSASLLSLQGWNTRYEFKLGVFAEFRQEMEAACRNYEASYEALLSSDLFEAISTQSSRFSEARQLSDIIAIRIIRCLLWSSQTIAACKWWSKHQARIHDFVTHKGIGVEGNAWEAWQTIWCRTMSDLIQRSAVFTVGNNPDGGPSAVLPVRLHEERPTSQTQPSLPWESLHHEGYWLRKAASHILEKRRRASEISGDEKRTEESPSDGSTAYNHSADYRDTLEAAITAFQTREQRNFVDSIRFNQASDLLTTASYNDALDYLKSLNQNTHWRVQGWWKLVETLAEAVSSTAGEIADLELQLVAEWELASLNGIKHKSPLMSSESNEDPSHVRAVAVDLSHHISPVACTFVFGSDVGHVGEHTSAQLTLKSLLTSPNPRLDLLEIKVVFDGGIRPIVLIASPQEVTNHDPATKISDLALDESAVSSSTKRLSVGAVAHSTAEAQLDLHPGQNRVFNMKLVPKEAGPVSVSSITVLFGRDHFQLTTTNVELSAAQSEWWELRKSVPVPRLIGKDRDATTINILPKPPKVALLLPDLKATYYTNEQIKLSIEVSNNEDEPVKPQLSVRLISPRHDSTAIQWEDDQATATVSEGEAKEVIQTLPVRVLEDIQPGSNLLQSVSISGLLDSVDHELEIFVEYCLPSDPGTTLRQSLAADLAIIRPFELNTAFHPRVGQETWPNFFAYDIEDVGKQAMGLKQHFYVLVDIASFALEALQIRSVAIAPVRIVGDATAVFSEPSLRLPNLDRQPLSELPDGIEISPESIHQFAFDLTLQKFALANRDPVSNDFGVSIQWSHLGAKHVHTSVLPIPKFLAPMSEPRVLLESHASTASTGAYEIVYTLENPSMHFLTFSITMESSEQLAFSGPKAKTLSLVPISRLSFKYNILPFVKREWVRVPIEVNDSYFGQTLKVQPASDGVRVDKQGYVQIWIDE